MRSARRSCSPASRRRVSAPLLSGGRLCPVLPRWRAVRRPAASPRAACRPLRAVVRRAGPAAAAAAVPAAPAARAHRSRSPAEDPAAADRRPPPPSPATLRASARQHSADSAQHPAGSARHPAGSARHPAGFARHSAGSPSTRLVLRLGTLLVLASPLLVLPLEPARASLPRAAAARSARASAARARASAPRASSDRGAAPAPAGVAALRPAAARAPGCCRDRCRRLSRCSVVVGVS